MPIVGGTLLGPNVRVVKPLGSGAMGAVWLAENASLGSHVAVKVLHAARNDAKGRARFMREARAAAKLVSPHIVRVFDVGTTEEGELYLVMERLHGRDLRHVIEVDGALSLARAALIITHICRGLQHAHEHGMLHRDIKPANVFVVEVDDAPFVKLLDFGIAKLSEDDLDLTASGTLVGTPFYMSPEQLVAPSEVDRRSDLWSVAVVAYVCLTGRLPFHGESVGALSIAVHSGAFEPPSRANSHLPATLDAFFARAFSVDRDRRFQSARELQAALAAELGGAPGVAETIAAKQMPSNVCAGQHDEADEALVSPEAETLDESTASRPPARTAPETPTTPETSTDAQTLDSTTNELARVPRSRGPRPWGIAAGVSALGLCALGALWVQGGPRSRTESAAENHATANHSTAAHSAAVTPSVSPSTTRVTHPAPSAPTRLESGLPSPPSSAPPSSSTPPSASAPPHLSPPLPSPPARQEPAPPRPEPSPTVALPAASNPAPKNAAEERPPARESWP